VTELEKHLDEFGDEKIDSDHYFIDFRLYNLNMKIYQLRNTPRADLIKAFQPFSEAEFSGMIWLLNNINWTIIGEQRIFRAIIDSQFVLAKSTFSKQFLIYILFFLIPFLMIAMDVNPMNIPAYICFCTQFLILIGEFMQLMGGVGDSIGAKLGTYFVSIWNYIDIMHITCFMLYFAFRATYGTKVNWLHDDGDLDGVSEEDKLSVEQMATLTLIKSFMVLLMICKCMYFARIWYGMGKMVELVGRVLTTSAPFSLFFFGWIYVFSVLFYTLGNEIDREGGGFVGLNDFFMYFI